MNDNPTNGSQACAACKYQRRKCVPDCPLAPYFPPEQTKHFLDAHKLFGVSNIMKTLKNLGPKEKEIAMKCMIFQANARANDPVGGCYRMIRELQQQIEHGDAELKLVLHQLAICRMRAQIIEAQEENTIVDVDVDPLSMHDRNYMQYGAQQSYEYGEQEYCPVKVESRTLEPFVEECEDIKPILGMFDDRQPPPVPFDFKESILCSEKVVMKQDVDSVH